MTSPVKYNPNVPESSRDNLAESQIDILTNFSTLFDIFTRNHIDINTATIGGFHNIIELNQQQSDPQTNVDEFAFFCKNVDEQTDQVFCRYQGNGTVFQLTNYQIYSIPSTGPQRSYFTFLPGKILVYFGDFTNLHNNVLQLTPPIAKKIISAGMCPSSDFNRNQKQAVVPIKNAFSGFYDKIEILPGQIFTVPLPLLPSYYWVFATI